MKKGKEDSPLVLLLAEQAEAPLGELVLNLEDEVFLVTDQLTVVQDCKLILTWGRSPLDLELAGLHGIRQNRHIDLDVILGLLTMTASVREGNCSKLALGKLVLIVCITNVDIHVQGLSRHNLQPTTLARIVNRETENTLVVGSSCLVNTTGRRRSGSRLSSLGLGRFSLFHTDDGVGLSVNQVVANRELKRIRSSAWQLVRQLEIVALSMSYGRRDGASVVGNTGLELQ